MKEIAVEHTSMFKKGARLNFQVFHTLEIGSKNLEFMHLISSAVLSGHMDNVCFYNASFLSTKFTNVDFENAILKALICALFGPVNAVFWTVISAMPPFQTQRL